MNREGWDRVRRCVWLTLGCCTVTLAQAGQTRVADVPEDHPARPAVDAVVARGLMSAPRGRFQPERPVTRAELAMVLVRFVDAVEKGGPHPFDASPARRDASAAQVAALRKFQDDDPASSALRRLVRGGYLSPPDRAGWLPSRQRFHEPVTASEVSAAFASVLLRVEEKKVAVDRPEALREGLRPEAR